MLLRVAPRLRHGVRIGSYVVPQAWSPTIRASFVGQQRPSSNAQSGRSCAAAGATTSQTAAQSRIAYKELRRQEAEFDEGGGPLSVDGRGRDGLKSP